ncbi:MAG: hypothetical protein L3J96_06035, partial [Thermoplasmata archaeon]|nr:hypothetical protein [Thermoplasmata archaeon]
GGSRSMSPFTQSTRRPLAPYLVAGALLAVLIASAFVPNNGASAQTTCPYGSCPGLTAGAGNNTWEVLLILLVVVAVVLGLLVMRGRRRQSAGGLTPYEEPPGLSGDVGPASEAVPFGAGAAVAGSPYVEGPEDVGATPPSIDDAAAAGAVGAAGGAAAAGGEADIDSLMQELDKISGEILQRGTPGKKGGSATPPEGEEGSEPPA